MTLPKPLDPIDVRLTDWMARYGITLTRLALGVVFLWFGVIKFVPGWTPAPARPPRPFPRLSFGTIGPAVSLPLLATWESLIGVGLLTGRFLRVTLLLLF